MYIINTQYHYHQTTSSITLEAYLNLASKGSYLLERLKNKYLAHFLLILY